MTTLSPCEEKEELIAKIHTLCNKVLRDYSKLETINPCNGWYLEIGSYVVSICSRMITNPPTRLYDLRLYYSALSKIYDLVLDGIALLDADDQENPVSSA